MSQLYIKKPSGRYTVAEPDCVLKAASDVIDKTFADGQQHVSAKTIGNYIKVRLARKKHEVFHVLFFDGQHRIIAEEELFQGSIDSASVYPREVVTRVIYHNAAAVILAHNHPSGDVVPSKADIAITARLKQALGLLDVNVLDHFIVGKDVYSFAENGQL
ncbi:MAG TPA: DNA repair protein [Crenotrichaceae bacterium]|nr:DNA repair protein [Crenotrichaceae bacterium]